MKNVTYQQTLEAMRAAVEEKGEKYVYQRPKNPHIPGDKLGSCLNTSADGKEPGCLVGNVFHRLGVPLEWLFTPEIINNSAGGVISALRQREEYEFDEKSYKLLAEAQSLQDQGAPWGQALTNAISYVETGVHVD